MPISFGAVGDIISVCLLVKDLVDALDEARGSKAEYRSVVRELWILDRALLEIDLLARTHGNGSTPELRGLCETAQRAATKCKSLVAEFLERIKKYKASFDDGHKPGMLRKTVMGVRWRVGEKEALERFRVEIAGTSSSLQMLLATANVNLLALGKKDLQDQLNQIEQRNEQHTSGQHALLLEVKDRISNATQQITNGNTALSKITDALRLDWLRQLGSDLKSLLRKVIATNIVTYHAIVSIQTVLSSRLERTLIEEPFILEDPIGRIAPVHLQFVTSWDAFNAVLEIRFRNRQGFKKIKDKQYGLQEKATRREIDQSRPWQRSFLPGQRIDMSFIFRSNEPDNEDSNRITCPGCQTGSSCSADADVQCSNCLMWFRRVIVITEVDPPATVPLPNPWKSMAAFGKPSFSTQLSGPLRPGKRRIAADDLEGEDDMSEFRRVRLVAEKRRVKRQRFMSVAAENEFTTFSKPPVAPMSNSATEKHAPVTNGLVSSAINTQYRPQLHAYYTKIELEKARQVGLISKSAGTSESQTHGPETQSQRSKMSRRHSLPALIFDYSSPSKEDECTDKPMVDISPIADSHIIAALSYDHRPANTLLYDILNISDWRVSQEEIENAYQRIWIKTFGPQSSSPIFNAAAAAHLTILNEAQWVLSDPTSREEYHQTGEVPGGVQLLQWFCRAMALLTAAAEVDALDAEFLTMIKPPSCRREQSKWRASEYALPDLSTGLDRLLDCYYDRERLDPNSAKWLPDEREEILSLIVSDRVKIFSMPLCEPNVVDGNAEWAMGPERVADADRNAERSFYASWAGLVNWKPDRVLGSSSLAFNSF
ncbi:hypothetical protein N0V90_000992 [Kalmusia sp. IMI 367209]|nr:hypothetical protein N0V90_000992 [Kalmusia sp. IMI 367209]